MRTALRWLRNGWLILGITLLAFLGLEAGFQLLALLGSGSKVSLTAADGSRRPYADSDWFGVFNGSHGLKLLSYRYDPYVGHLAKPLNTRYLHIDSLGRRLTLPAPTDSATAPLVFMLGGSAMWGMAARDSFTIPSRTAAGLRARGLTDINVVNLAQPAFNSTQELITLNLELARATSPAWWSTSTDMTTWPPCSTMPSPATCPAKRSRSSE